MEFAGGNSGPYEWAWPLLVITAAQDMAAQLHDLTSDMMEREGGAIDHNGDYVTPEQVAEERLLAEHSATGQVRLPRHTILPLEHLEENLIKRRTR